MIKRIDFNKKNIQKIVQEIRCVMHSYNIILLNGPIGSGKTTLVQALLKQCGVIHPAPSPTFTYIHIYSNNKGERFYHFDLYRIKNIDEWFDLGFDEYLHIQHSWSIIEWPEVIKPFIAERALDIRLSYHSNPLLRTAEIEIYTKKDSKNGK